MATRRKPPATGGTVRSVSVHGLRTRVEVRGEGPPLLLVMGLWGDIEAWDPLIERLDGFRTIAFDAPGIGGTELPAVPLSLPALGRFTAGVLDAVGVARAHVLGVSFVVGREQINSFDKFGRFISNVLLIKPKALNPLGKASQG